MKMSPLIICSKKLEKRLDYLASGLARAKLTRTQSVQMDQVARQEGLVSALWQSWCGFIRSVILHSAVGATTSGGAQTTSPYAALHVDQIRNIAAKAAKRNGIPAVIAPISGFHNEPTWGDINRATLIVNALNLTNSGSILSGLGILTFGKDLQIVRNAAAHLSTDRISDIKNLQLKYINTSFRHPTDALFWTEGSTGNDAWEIWIDELRASATSIVS